VAITALVDGLWLELCLSPAVLDANEARTIAEDQIAALLG
jgi:TetR/AcrR family transcriptional repressor of bet genes